MIVGIDLGYSHTKICNGAKTAGFASVVGNFERARFTANGNDQDGAAGIAIEINDDTFAIGEEALQTSRFASRREDRDWIVSLQYVRLFIAALSAATTSKFTAMNIVTGLPVTYITDRDRLASTLACEWKFHRAGRQHRQMVRVGEVTVIPQPFGTLLAQVLDNHGRIADTDLATGRIGVVDIGGKTTGFLTVNKLREIPQATGSIDVGAWDALTLARDAISNQYPGLDLADHEVSACASTCKTVSYFGKPVDVSELIANALHPLADRVINEASARWDSGARLDTILVTGGGAHLIGKAICAEYRHARVVPKAAFANVLGYWRYGQRIREANG